MLIERIDTPTTEAPRQFLAWAADIPYLITYTPAGAGYFDAFSFIRADDDFIGTLADQPRFLAADPADVARVGAVAYIEAVLNAVAADTIAEAA